MGYYIAIIKKNQLLLHIKTWTNLTKITLGEKSQTQKIRHYMVHLYTVNIQSSEYAALNFCIITTWRGRDGDWEGS